MHVQTIAVLAVSLMLVEGFALSLFPEQIRQMLRDSDSRSLQWAGLVETTVAVALLLALILA